MSSIIQPNYGVRAYGVPTKASETKQTGTQGRSFLDLAARASRGTTDVLEISNSLEITNEAETSNVDAYMEHLKKKYGRVTIESVGKDQASLEKAGKRMSGNDVVIAPNILEEMAGDVKKALYYEQKIDYFFNTVIPPRKCDLCRTGLGF